MNASNVPSVPISTPEAKGTGKTLFAGGLAALLASACCLGPLVLIMVGVSGAWIAYLTALEPYQLIFIGAAILALFLAARQIWRPAAACEPGQICSVPAVKRKYKWFFGLVVFLLVAGIGFPLIAPWFY